MKSFFVPRRLIVVALGASLLSTAGCGRFRTARMLYQDPPAPAPLGTISDRYWQRHEEHSEASDFVVRQHEFDLNSHRLNLGGEDHVKQIAARLSTGQTFPIVIERSMTTVKPGTTYKYPIHPNRELDLQRREVVVKSLQTMGIADAEAQVVVAPDFATGMKEMESEGAYQRLRGMGSGFGGGGFGGGMGGFGGFGGGAIGGGFF
jgi:hypothetical protein